MDMVVTMVLIASCFFSVALNEYSDAVGEENQLLEMKFVGCLTLPCRMKDDLWVVTCGQPLLFLLLLLVLLLRMPGTVTESPNEI